MKIQYLAAILIIVGSVAFWFSGTILSGSSIEYNDKTAPFNEGCKELVSVYHCDMSALDTIITDYKETSSNTKEYSLFDMCKLMQIDAKYTCAKVCGCDVKNY